MSAEDWIEFYDDTAPPGTADIELTLDMLRWQIDEHVEGEATDENRAEALVALPPELGPKAALTLVVTLDHVRKIAKAQAQKDDEE